MMILIGARLTDPSFDSLLLNELRALVSDSLPNRDQIAVSARSGFGAVRNPLSFDVVTYPPEQHRRTFRVTVEELHA